MPDQNPPKRLSVKKQSHRDFVEGARARRRKDFLDGVKRRRQEDLHRRRVAAAQRADTTTDMQEDPAGRFRVASTARGAPWSEDVYYIFYAHSAHFPILRQTVQHDDGVKIQFYWPRGENSRNQSFTGRRQLQLHRALFQGELTALPPEARGDANQHLVSSHTMLLCNGLTDEENRGSHRRDGLYRIELEMRGPATVTRLGLWIPPPGVPGDGRNPNDPRTYLNSRDVLRAAQQDFQRQQFVTPRNELRLHWLGCRVLM